MPYGALGAAHIDLRRTLFASIAEEKCFDGGILCRVANDCGRCMGIDVVYLSRRDVGVSKGPLHRGEGTFSVLLGCGKMMCVGGSAVTSELGVDPCTSGFGMFQFLTAQYRPDSTKQKGEGEGNDLYLENYNCCALAYHEALAIGIKGS